MIIEYASFKKVNASKEHISIGLQSQYGSQLFDTFLNVLVKEFKINISTEENYLNIPSIMTGGRKGKLILNYF